MQINEHNESNLQQKKQLNDAYAYPLPVRIKHPAWSVRKQLYEQILYLLKTLNNLNQQMMISGNSYTIQTLMPYFQFLIQEKHSSVLMKGLECVQQILKLDKKSSSKHCIRTLIDKGIQYFPLLSQNRKAILQKFLDILELSKIDANFLKNKLNLPHQKSVMYVIQVIGVLNVTSLKSILLNVSKKHQKKCVRQLALEIAEEFQQGQGLQQSERLNNNEENKSNSNGNTGKGLSKNNKPVVSNSTCKITIQKLPHYQQLNSKKQQQFSTQISQKINQILLQYTSAQLPNFSHFLRLMIDDNNHIINTNAIRCLIVIFNKQRDQGFNKNSLLPLSFPLLFIFNKFKSHKTHPINILLLNLVQSILQAPVNRFNDLFLAINEGLSCIGSKANVKFGCALTFFRIISLVYHNQDLYNCTKNQNVQSENQDLEEKFKQFQGISLGKNHHKFIQKILLSLQKDKKYDTQIYLIKHAIGIDFNSIPKSSSQHDLVIKNNKSNSGSIKKSTMQTSHQRVSKQYQLKRQKKQTITLPKQKSNSISGSLSKTLKNSKSANKFLEINLQQTLNQIIKLLNKHDQYQQKKAYFSSLNKLLQKSSQQFYQSVRQKRYQMFYLCQLLQNFIQHYQPNDSTAQTISQFLINILKIISLLQPSQAMNGQTSSNKQQDKKINQFSINNISQLLLVALCKLSISEQIQQVLQNLMQNYNFDIIYQSLQNLFIKNANNEQNKIKKKNKKFLLAWLESNTPALYVNADYYKLVEKIEEKNNKTSKVKDQISAVSHNQTNYNNNNQLNEKQHHHNRLHHLDDYQKASKHSNFVQNSHKQYQQYSPNTRKQKYLSNQLQKLNLSKIQQKASLSNYYEEDMEKSSFHQNLEEHLKQISTQRSCQEDVFQRKDFDKDSNHQNTSRQYLKKLQMNSFKKKNQNQMILQSSPFKEDNDVKRQDGLYEGELGIKMALNYNQENNFDNNNDQKSIEYQYEQKFNEVQRRRLERQKERRQFMNRMKSEFKPLSKNNQQQHDSAYLSKRNQQVDNNKDQSNDSSQKYPKEDNQSSQSQKIKVSQQNSSNIYGNNQKIYQNQQNISLNNDKVTATTKDNFVRSQQTEQKQQTVQKSLKHKNLQNSVQESFVSSTQSSQFKYRLINSEKMIYMLKSTNNPYPHLRTLILIPFKSSQKKHQFLRQLLHFFSNQIQFKIPQPYNSLVLLTILLFSQIKQDKTLIQPLQSLYQFVAKQSTTNEFVKTLINLFHSVIQQTLPQNRKFLITILLKSMIRMLPFIEDGVSLLRDIQQFYQIGQMVYFQMFDQQYSQIKNYIEQQGVHIIVEKGLDEEGDNLRSIVEGWLTTSFKSKVLEVIEEFRSYHQEGEGGQQYQQQQQNNSNKYQSYL